MKKRLLFEVLGTPFGIQKDVKIVTFSKVKNMVSLCAYHAFGDLGLPRIEKKAVRKVSENVGKVTSKKVTQNLQKTAIFGLKK